MISPTELLEVAGLVGALLLAAATLPQALHLVRIRRAEDFHGSFIGVSLAGCLLLAVHALALGDTAFLAVNAVGVGFWSLCAWMRFGSASTPAEGLGDAIRGSAP